MHRLSDVAADKCKLRKGRAMVSRPIACSPSRNASHHSQPWTLRSHIASEAAGAVVWAKVLLEHKEHTFALIVAGFVLAMEHGSQQVPEELPSVEALAVVCARVSDMLS